MRHTPLPLIALVIALAATLGGCGGASTAVDDLPADAVFLTAVDRSTDISTVHVEYESTSSRAGEVLHTGGGEAVFAPGAVSFTFTMGGWAGTEGDGAEDLEDLSYELRFVDGTVYLRVPEMPLGMAEDDLPDAQWIVYADGDMDEMAAQLDQFDFGHTLQALRDSAEVTEDGRETIAGVATTRYAGTTTLRSVMLAQGMTEERLEEEAGDAGPDLDGPMPLTVWIGDDGLIRRYDYTMVDDDIETTQSMTVLEYGLEVDITAPPAEETISAEEFESSYQSSTGTFEEYEEYELEIEDSGSIVVESESSATGTVTSERSATAESAPAPRSTADSDG